MSSHVSAPATSLLTVLALALVHRERPEWLAISVGDAARAAGFNHERVSRLATRVLRPLSDLVESFTQRGRPVRVHDPVRAELLSLRALLAVATAALALLPLRRPAVRALLVGAWLRLSAELPSLTKGAFCKALAVPERTLRHWLAHAPSATATPTPAPSPAPAHRPQRPPRRPRFRFDVWLPGTQVGADTTDLCAFGIPLKLVGVQDIGGRDRSLASALYDGAKASAAAGRRADALSRYARVEQVTPPSRRADDARFHAAELVRAAGDEPRALAMWASIPDAFPEGDVRHEAIFRVALAALVKGDRAAAKVALDKALSIDPHDHAWATAGRAAYFRATVAQGEGATEDAKSRYAELVAEEPLAYYAGQAYARLAAIDAAAAKAALDAAVAREPDGPLTSDGHPELSSPPFARARALLEVGEVDAARHELSSAGLFEGDVDPEVVWAEAWLFDAARAPEVGASLARGRLSEYLAHYPAGRWRAAWEIAYPRAFEPLVERASRDADIPAPLTWAIMREESSFRANSVRGL